MLYDDITFFLIAFHRIIDVDTRLGVIPLFKQYPGIRIKKSSIIRFGFYRLIAHFLGLAVLPTDSKHNYSKHLYWTDCKPTRNRMHCMHLPSAFWYDKYHP